MALHAIQKPCGPSSPCSAFFVQISPFSTEPTATVAASAVVTPIAVTVAITATATLATFVEITITYSISLPFVALEDVLAAEADIMLDIQSSLSRYWFCSLYRCNSWDLDLYFAAICEKAQELLWVESATKLLQSLACIGGFGFDLICFY